MPEPTSCATKKPFMELGTENAPKLNYKLPQTNGFVVNMPLKLDLSAPDFIMDPGIGIPPTSSYYDKITVLGGDDEARKQAIKVNISNGFVGNSGYDPIAEVGLPGNGFFPVGDVANSATVGLGATSTNEELKIGGRPIDDVAGNAVVGYPKINVDLAGRQYVTFVPQPSDVSPCIYIVEHYRV